jgi:hypothetical protein
MKRSYGRGWLGSACTASGRNGLLLRDGAPAGVREGVIVSRVVRP